jgi:serine/threonine protein kinase
MAYLHSKQIIHRDLKPENVFLDDNWEPVIADFGLSKFWAGNVDGTAGLGSALFMAPEIADRTRYDLSVDVYSFAVLLYTMFLPSPTPKFADGTELRGPLQLLQRASTGMRFERLPTIPDYYWGLIERCWSHIRENRPPFAELVTEFRRAHEYVFEGADLAEVNRYEEFLSGAVPSGDGDDPPPGPLSKSPRPPASSRQYLYLLLFAVVPILLAVLLHHLH